MLSEDQRNLRADARQNEDRVLEAAAAAFQRDGADTSMKAIAKEAGVGIGTLYRRFPTREQLIETVYRSETERLALSADRLLKRMPAEAALRRWMDGFLDYMLTKHGMAEALPVILAQREGLRLHSRDLLRNAISRLLDAAHDTVRDDVTADDVMMAIGGIALVSAHETDRALAARLADLLVAGLTSSKDEARVRSASRNKGD